jgi:uncharacterized protein
MKMGPIGWIAFILVVVGGLNWGLVGIFNFNLISAIFGDMSALARIIYILVGLSALLTLVKPFSKGKVEAAAPVQM